MTGYVELSYLQVALAALLMIAVGAISVALKLGLERPLLIASLRTIVQLSLVGFVLQWVFALDTWYVVLAVASLMTLVAALTAANRNDRRHAGTLFDTVVSVWASSWVVTAFALFVVVRSEEPWYEPRFAIPLLGMVLGNALNGISVGIDTFMESLATRGDEVESLLSLGATRWEAARGPLRHAVRVGMTPIVNSMMVVGIVSLPGMMTGQLLAGTSPVEAVKYQIVVMFLIAAATASGTVGVVLLGYFRLFNTDHQFLRAKIDSIRAERSS